MQQFMIFSITLWQRRGACSGKKKEGPSGVGIAGVVFQQQRFQPLDFIGDSGFNRPQDDRFEGAAQFAFDDARNRRIDLLV
jgi:hypothetical protein